MESTICNLCGQDRPEPYALLPDLLLGRPDVITQLVKCANCGLVYQNPRPTLAEMSDHYPAEYESYDPSPDPESMSWPARQGFLYGRRKRMRAVTRFSTGGELLDVGCAAGTFLLGMRELPSWQVQGVEVSPHAAEIARSRFGLKVFTGTLEAAEFPAESFDAVTLWDVFEHLHSPAATLDEIYRILRPGGVLVMRLPNLDAWDAKWFGDNWAGLDAPRHTYVFGRQPLRRMVRQQGYVVRRMATEMGGYMVFVLSLRFRMQRRGLSTLRQERLSRLLYHPIARLLSIPFFYVLGLGQKGPLLTLTAEKVTHD
jgi:SAM-dependent methyltransferase